jgi:hypothetical protein
LAIEYFPNYFVAYIYRGKMLAREKSRENYEKAERDFEKAI